ncbi:MAG: hypothetical protein PVI63_10685, partial [Anaerolineae bacterium]
TSRSSHGGASSPSRGRPNTNSDRAGPGLPNATALPFPCGYRDVVLDNIAIRRHHPNPLAHAGSNQELFAHANGRASYLTTLANDGATGVTFAVGAKLAIAIGHLDEYRPAPAYHHTGSGGGGGQHRGRAG